MRLSRTSYFLKLHHLVEKPKKVCSDTKKPVGLPTNYSALEGEIQYFAAKLTNKTFECYEKLNVNPIPIRAVTESEANANLST